MLLALLSYVIYPTFSVHWIEHLGMSYQLFLTITEDFFETRYIVKKLI